MAVGFLDVFFDNIGGETLDSDFALTFLNKGAGGTRVMCLVIPSKGCVADYNTSAYTCTIGPELFDTHIGVDAKYNQMNFPLTHNLTARKSSPLLPCASLFGPDHPLTVWISWTDLGPLEKRWQDGSPMALLNLKIHHSGRP